jgi:hypothetical protein
LEIVERVSSFACLVGVRVHIHSGDYKIEDANVSKSTAKQIRALSEKNQTEDSAVSNNDVAAYEIDNTYQPASEQWGARKLMQQWSME